MTQNELNIAVSNHCEWLCDRPGGARLVLKDVDLSGRTFQGAYLERAVLENCDLRHADMRYANLREADLSGSNLTDANLATASLKKTNLRNTNLTRTNFEDATMNEADLRGASGFKAPTVPDIDTAILRAIESGGGLDMSYWHSCKTTHCRAGWATTLAGRAGKRLEKKLGCSAAGALIYAKSRPDRPVPDWYASHEDAMDDIQKCAQRRRA